MERVEAESLRITVSLLDPFLQFYRGGNWAQKGKRKDLQKF